MAHELNATDIIARSVERNRYFYGKLMTVRDFLQEQQYFNSKRHLLNRLLFGSGVICGLDVREGATGMSATQIDVDPGVALDPLGREITVTRRDRFDLRNLKDLKPVGSKTERTILICLAYNECQKEPVPSMKSSPCDEACESNRINERYTIEWDDPTPAPDQSLCEEWMNRSTVASAATGQVRVERSAPLWVRQGETFEVVVKVTARQNVASAQLTEIITNGNVIEPVITSPNPPLNPPAGQFPTPPVSLQDGEFFVYVYQVEAPKREATITIRTGGGLPATESNIKVVTDADADGREIDQRLKVCDETPPRLCVPIAEATVKFSGSQVSGIKKLETRGVQRFRYNLERVSELLECVRENIQAAAGSPRPGHALITFKDLENREPQPVRATPGTRGASFTVARGDHTHALLLESQSGLIFGEGNRLRVDGAVGGQAIDFQHPVLGRSPVQSRHLVTKEYVDSKLAGLDWRESVKDKDRHAPPASPAEGDRYLVLSTTVRPPVTMPPQPPLPPEELRIKAAADEEGGPPPPPKDDDVGPIDPPDGRNPWKGFETRITTWNGAEWEFEPIPDEGTAVFVEDENTAYLFVDGRWIPFLAQPSITAGDGLKAEGAILSVGQGAGLQVNADDVTLAFAGNAALPVGDRRSAGNDNTVARGDHEHELPLANNSGLEFISPSLIEPTPAPKPIYPPPIIKPPAAIEPQGDINPEARPEEATLPAPDSPHTRDASARLNPFFDIARFDVASPNFTPPAPPPPLASPKDEIKPGVVPPRPSFDTPIGVRPPFESPLGFPLPTKLPTEPAQPPSKPPIPEPPVAQPPIFQPPIFQPTPPISPPVVPPVKPPQPPIIEPPSPLPLPLPRPSRFKQLRVNGPVGGEQIDFLHPVLGQEPSQPRHLATKQYVDGKIAGLDWQESVKDKDLTSPPSRVNAGDRYLILSDEIIIRPPAPDDLPPKPTDEESARPTTEGVLSDQARPRIATETPEMSEFLKPTFRAGPDDSARLPPAGGGGGEPIFIPPPRFNPWRGHVNEITTWNGSEWEFITADEGTAVFVEDENTAYLFVDKKWIPFLASGQTQIKAGAGLRLEENTLSVVSGAGLQIGEEGVGASFGATPPPPVSRASNTGWSDDVARADHTHQLSFAPDSGLMFRDVFTKLEREKRVETIARPTPAELQINGPVGGERINFLQTVSGQDPSEPQHLVTKRYVDSKIAGLDWQQSVLDKDARVPPKASKPGVRYLVLDPEYLQDLNFCPPIDGNPWGGHRGDIATWNGETWDFTPPNEGMTVFVEDENNAYIYFDEKWVQFLSLATPPPPPPSNNVAETTTGIVVFEFNNRIPFEPVVSNPIDAQVGSGPICVRLGLEDKERGILVSPDSFTFRELGYPPVELAAEIIYGRFRESENTMFRIWVRVSEKTEIPATNFAVRWWAYPAGKDLGVTFFNEDGKNPAGGPIAGR